MTRTERHPCRTLDSTLSFGLCTALLALTGQVTAQVVLQETFTPPAGCTAPIAPWMPDGWTRFNVDALTPNSSVAYVNAAWIVREDEKRSNPTSYADYPNPDATPVARRVLQGEDVPLRVVRGLESLRGEPSCGNAFFAKSKQRAVPREHVFVVQSLVMAFCLIERLGLRR